MPKAGWYDLEPSLKDLKKEHQCKYQSIWIVFKNVVVAITAGTKGQSMNMQKHTQEALTRFQFEFRHVQNALIGKSNTLVQ